ncbi:MAG: hypothetical protein OEW15_07740 [Nitrospirota bacterium]|nr:hypothetical protein [Nitrospirota bacterium]
MTVWEKALVNMEKGYTRVTSFAGTLSERVKSDIAIIRIRMQMDRVQKAIGEQHRKVGERLLEQSTGGTLPANFAAFFKQGEIASLLERIAQLEKEADGLLEELSREADAIKAKPKQPEGKHA